MAENFFVSIEDQAPVVSFNNVTLTTKLTGLHEAYHAVLVKMGVGLQPDGSDLDYGSSDQDRAIFTVNGTASREVADLVEATTYYARTSGFSISYDSYVSVNMAAYSQGFIYDLLTDNLEFAKAFGYNIFRNGFLNSEGPPTFVFDSQELRDSFTQTSESRNVLTDQRSLFLEKSLEHPLFTREYFSKDLLTDVYYNKSRSLNLFRSMKPANSLDHPIIEESEDGWLFQEVSAPTNYMRVYIGDDAYEKFGRDASTVENLPSLDYGKVVYFVPGISSSNTSCTRGFTYLEIALNADNVESIEFEWACQHNRHSSATHYNKPRVQWIGEGGSFTGYWTSTSSNTITYSWQNRVYNFTPCFGEGVFRFGYSGGTASNYSVSARHWMAFTNFRINLIS